MAGLNSGFEYRERLSAGAAGVMLIDYLARNYPKFTRKEWTGRIESGRVLLDGIPSGQDTVLQPGRVLSWVRPPWVEPEVPLFFAILYRDAHLLGIAKPAGLPTVPGGGSFMEHTLLARVRIHYPGAIPLHRLGRGTSGVILFATTHEAASAVSSSWAGRRVLKVYRALACGTPAADTFEIDAPIGPVPHPVLKTVQAACPDGKPAYSHVRVLERRNGCSLLQVRITTGRPHQIRIHLAAAGHPLVGDPLYAAGGLPAGNNGALPGDLGYHLHSELLGFSHPATGEWTEIACAPPPLLRLAR